MKTVLLATAQKFWFDDRGDRKRTAGLCKFLIKQGFRLEVFYTGVLTDDDRSVTESRYGDVAFHSTVIGRPDPRTPLSERNLDYFYSAATQEEFRDLCRRLSPDVVIVSYLHLAYLVKGLREGLPKTPLTMIDTLDVLCLRCERFRDMGEDHWIAITEKEEREALDLFDVVVAIQPMDAAQFRKMLPDKRVVTALHAAPATRCPSRTGPQTTLVYVATGGAANRRAIEQFLDSVWPTLYQRFGDRILLCVVGEICQRLDESGAGPGVQLQGYVEDLGRVYREADIVINPVTFGGGLKIKNVEALCNAKPLVTTSMGAEGLENGANDAFLVCDTTDEMTQGLSGVIENAASREQLSDRAYQFASQTFSPERAYGELHDVLTNAGSSRTFALARARGTLRRSLMRICVLNHAGPERHVACMTASFLLEKELRRRFGQDAQIEGVYGLDCELGRAAPGEDETVADYVESVRDKAECLDVMRRADVVVLNGGASLRWPSTDGRAWAWLALAELAKADYDLPVWVVNAAFVSSDRRFLELGARAFAKADHVALQDPQSLKTVEQLGVNGAVQAADLVFLAPARLSKDLEDHIAAAHPFWARSENERRIILAGSNAITRATSTRWRDTYLSVIEQLTAQGTAVRVLFLAHADAEDELALARELSSLCENVSCLAPDMTAAEAIWLLRQADVAVSGRYGVNCFAMLARTPAVVLPDSASANAALVRMVNSPCLREESIHDPDAIVKLCGELSERGASLACREGGATDRLRQLAARNFPSTASPAPSGAEEVDLGEYLLQTQYLGEYSRRIFTARLDALQRQKDSVERQLRGVERVDEVRAELVKERSRSGEAWKEVDALRTAAKLRRRLASRNLRAAIEKKDRNQLKLKLELKLTQDKLRRIRESTAYKIGSTLRSMAYFLFPRRKQRMQEQAERQQAKAEEMRVRARAKAKTPLRAPELRFHAADIKVLSYALTPLAGSPIRISRILNKSKSLSAICVNGKGAYSDGRAFPHDLCYNEKSDMGTEGLVTALLDEADIVHFHNESHLNRPPLFAQWAELKRCCVQWHSGPDEIAHRFGMSVERASKWNELATLVVAQKQARFYPGAIPVPNAVDLEDAAYRPLERDKEKIHIGFTPAEDSRPFSMLCREKGKSEILAALELIQAKYPEEVEVHVVQNKPLLECLCIKQRCHVCIDDVKSGGYHLSSLEGLAMGCVTVANLDRTMKEFLAEYVGCAEAELPWYPANAENLVERLEALIKNRDLIEETGRNSRAWMEKYWNQEFVVRKYRKAYQRV